MNERDLLVAFKAARQELDAIKEQLKDVQARYDKAEMELVEYLTSNQADSTAEYVGIGYAKMMKPRVYASCLKDNEEWLKEYLRTHDRSDMIREVVPAPSLSAFVGELVEAGKPIPDKINYYLKSNVRIY